MSSTITESSSVDAAVGNPYRDLFWRLAREAGLMIGLYLVYKFGRVLADRNPDEAFSHAHDVWRFERALWMPSEASLQQWILGLPDLVIQSANIYYSSVHFPATILMLVWLFIARPRHYVWVRRILVTLTGLGLVGHLAYPLAPPRMLPEYGLVDTGIKFGQSVYGPPNHDGLANQYAAMPSLHVGWAILVAIAVIVAIRHKWKWLLVIHPVITMLVVVVTANHYWLDGIVASALLGIAIIAHAKQKPTGFDKPLLPWTWLTSRPWLRRPKAKGTTDEPVAASSTPEVSAVEPAREPQTVGGTTAA